MKLPKPDEDVPSTHAFAAAEGCRRDAVLRSHGFEIHSRPKTGQSVWKRNGGLFEFYVAVAICRSEQENGKEKCGGKSKLSGDNSSTFLKGGL